MQEYISAKQSATLSPVDTFGHLPKIRITIIAVGLRSLEELRPFIALAIGLKNFGHRVTLATNSYFKDFVCRKNIEFVEITGNWARKAFVSFKGKQFLENGQIAKYQQLEHQLRCNTIHQERKDYIGACKDSDLLIANRIAIIEVWSVAEKYNIPVYGITFSPSENAFASTGDIPHPSLSGVSFGWGLSQLVPIDLSFSFLNKFSFTAMNWWEWKSCSVDINKFRKEILGLPAVSNSMGIPGLLMQSPWIHAYSQTICPVHFDSTNQMITGFLQSDFNQKIQEPVLYEVQPGSKEKVNVIPALKEFLYPEGPPIVYIALNDLPFSQHDSITKLLEITIDAVNELEVRCVIGGESGWKTILKYHIKQAISKQSKEDLESRKRKLEDDFFLLEFNPDADDFDDVYESVCKWTFPQCQCVVHHGSSTMTALSLTAGIPIVVISTFPEQAYWGNRICELAAGPQSIPFTQLTSSKLQDAIEYCLQREIRINSSKYGYALQKEDGVSACVKTISEYYFKHVKEKQLSETNKPQSTPKTQSPIQLDKKMDTPIKPEKSGTPINGSKIAIESTNKHIHVQ